MLFYVGLYLIATLFAFLYSNTKDKTAAVFPLIATFLILFLPSALRYGIGSDYFGYIDAFQMSGRTVNYYIEPGYQMLNVMIRNMGLNAQWVLAIMAFFTILFLFLSIPKRTFYLAIPLFMMLFYTLSFNGVRNCLTIMMGYYAYILFSKGKYVKSIIIILIAMQFHRSAGVMLLLFLIMHLLKIKKIHSFVIFGLLFCLIPVADNLVQFLLTGPFLPDRFRGLGSFIYQNQPDITRGLLTYSRFLCYMVLIFFVKNRSSKDNSASNIRICLLCLLLVDILASFSLSIMYRVTHIFSIAWLIAVYHFNITTFKLRKILITLMLLYSFIVFGYQTNRGVDEVVPYRSVLTK
jgi:hypothetical protein